MIYFGYGSNLNKTQMSQRCPDAEPIGSGILFGWELTFRGVADIEDGLYVPGGLWDISTRDLQALDHYEGYPSYYDRFKLEIDRDGELLDAWVYIMNGRNGYSPPSAHYLGTIHQGYIDFDLDVDYLDNHVERTPATKVG